VCCPSGTSGFFFFFRFFGLVLKRGLPIPGTGTTSLERLGTEKKKAKKEKEIHHKSALPAWGRLVYVLKSLY
jgi:hypothetical protein